MSRPQWPDSINSPSDIPGTIHFVSGALAPADAVTLRLKTVNNVLVLTDGHNHTTGEVIRLLR